MDKPFPMDADYLDADRRAVCGTVEGLAGEMEARAQGLDATPGFPGEDVAGLHAAGALLAPFPRGAGGLGMGTEPEGTAALCDMLRGIGRGSLAVGRLYEGHVNAVRLLARYGGAALVARAAADAAEGRLIGLWVTDDPGGALRVEGGRLRGGKSFCSGAGHAGWAVVTVETAEGARLAYVGTGEAAVRPLAGRMQGMRAAVTGQVSFEGVGIGTGDWVGEAGDYLREPEFSAGAWRTSAVTCGGLEALVEHAMRQLVSRGREGSPHQQARMGQAWIAVETARMWVSRAGAAAEAPGWETGDRVATVNLARIAVERACLEAMTLVERSLGLAALLQPEPIERIGRDLATYLRQPAADEVLAEAAAHVMRREVCGRP